MKKNYFSPEMTIFEIKATAMLAGSFGEGEGTLDQTETLDETEVAGKRRPNGRNVDFGQGYDDIEDGTSNGWE